MLNPWTCCVTPWLPPLHRTALLGVRAMTAAPQAGTVCCWGAHPLTCDCMSSVAPAGQGALYDHSGAPVKTWSTGSGDAGLPEPICLLLDEHLVSPALCRKQFSSSRLCGADLGCCQSCLALQRLSSAYYNQSFASRMHTGSVTGLPSGPDLYWTNCSPD